MSVLSFVFHTLFLSQSQNFVPYRPFTFFSGTTDQLREDLSGHNRFNANSRVVDAILFTRFPILLMHAR